MLFKEWNEIAKRMTVEKSKGSRIEPCGRPIF